MRLKPWPLHVVATSIFLTTLLAACGGGAPATPATPTAPVTPPVTQTIVLAAAANPMLRGGGQPVTVSATLNQSAAVSWQLGSGNPGQLSASTGTSVSYTPPASVSAITPVTITASAGGVSQSIKLALYPDPGTPGLSLLAGSLGERAIIDGSGTNARFMAIADLEPGYAGNMVVADQGVVGSNGLSPSYIRLVSAAGVVSTLAHRPFGHADGDATHGQMGQVSSVTATPDSSIYMIDTDSDAARLRQLKSDGSITTLANIGQQPGIYGNARLLADHAGTLYLIGIFGVYRVGSDGTITLLAGSSTSSGDIVDGQGASAHFGSITDITVDAGGNLYLIDVNCVRKITPAGIVTTVAGSTVIGGNTPAAMDGTGSAAIFAAPQSIAADASGNLLVLDYGYINQHTVSLIRQVTPAGVVSTLYSVAAGSNRLRINSANTILLNNGAQIQQLAPSGQVSAFAGLYGDSSTEVDGPGPTARFVAPYLLASDLAGNVYVVDAAGFQGGYQVQASGLDLRKIAPDGTVSTVALDSNVVQVATGMAIDADGNIYVSSVPPLDTLATSYGGTIYKITPAGAVTVFAGSGAQDERDGTGAAAAFTSPALAGIDAGGNLYVTDANRQVLDPATGSPTTVYRKITPQALVSTISALPAGLLAAPDGNVYSVDYNHDVVYRTTPDGSKTVVAGILDVDSTVLGPLPGSLYQPGAIVPTGPGSFVVISGSAVLRLVLPH